MEDKGRNESIKIVLFNLMYGFFCPCEARVAPSTSMVPLPLHLTFKSTAESSAARCNDILPQATF